MKVLATLWKEGIDGRLIISFGSKFPAGTVFPHLNMPFLPNSKFI